MIRLMALFVCLGFAATAASFPPLPKQEVEPKENAPQTEPKASEGKEVDVQKTAERIAENAQKAGDRLKEKDPGEATRKIQDEIIKDIDALIKKAQEPPSPPMPSDMNPMMPPPPKSDMSPPKGGMPPPMPMGGMTGGMPMPKSGGSGQQRGKRPRRERKPRGEQPTPMGGQPMAKRDPGGKEPTPAKLEPKEGKQPAGLGDRFGKPSPNRQNDKLADLYKDVWGHLPERLRQEMDLYYREQFMPRYSELLRRYYAALAEQSKKGSEDR